MNATRTPQTLEEARWLDAEAQQGRRPTLKSIETGLHYVREALESELEALAANDQRMCEQFGTLSFCHDTLDAQLKGLATVIGGSAE